MSKEMADADFEMLRIGVESHEAVVARDKARAANPRFDDLPVDAQRRAFRVAYCESRGKKP